MTDPVVDSVSFDKASYSPGEAISCTVSYAGSNTHPTTGTNYVVSGAVTDSGVEVGTFSGAFALNTGSAPNPLFAALSGGESEQTWTKVSDDGKSKAVFTAIAS